MKSSIEVRLDNHLEWLSSEGKSGKRFDASESDLKNAKFPKADLRKAIFEGAHLNLADFSSANLQDANFSGAVLDGASFQRANLKDANFQGASLNHAKFQFSKIRLAQNLNSADFRYADLLGQDLAGLDFQGTCFTGAELSRANLEGTNFGHADLSKADLTKTNIKESVNLKKANLREVKLTEVDLKSVDLSSAGLFKAILQKAQLEKANLENSDLRDTDFNGASLAGANLKNAFLLGSSMIGVDFNSADVEEADLRTANLEKANLHKILGIKSAQLNDVNLKDCTGLLGEEFAGTDVTGVTLPDDIAEFKGLDHVTELSKHARNIFLAMIGACVFSWLTIATTTDVGLLTNTAATPLPIIQTRVPIAGFYWVAPVILLGLYLYRHFYLQGLWEGLASLPAIFPDGRSLDQRAYPWLLTSLVREFVLLLSKERRPFTSLKAGISITAAWGLVPFTLILFWSRYLTLQSWFGTSSHIFILVVAGCFGAVSFQTALKTLRGTLELPEVGPTTDIWEHWKRKLLSLPDFRPDILTASSLVFFLMLTMPVSLGTIGVFLGESPNPWQVWIQAGKGKIVYYPYAELTEANVSTRPSDWWKANPDQEEKLKGIKGADLKRRVLRFASAQRSFLAKADLRGADLRWSNFVDADFRGADLHEANFTGAQLSSASLPKLELFATDFRGAEFIAAELQEADFGGTKMLIGANLSSANLSRANLRYVDFSKVNFNNTKLNGADLTGADLSRSLNLTQIQLLTACGNLETKLPAGFVDFKLRTCPKK
ncbi:MAG: pentapeptide repeat-containing protein [Rhodospirillales bacterium]